MRQYLVIVALLLLLTSCKEGDSRSSGATDPTPWTRTPSRAWTTTTPEGIQIIAAQSTVDQYELRWLKKWETINWQEIDNIFIEAYNYYCYDLDWDCKAIIPSDVTVYLKPWDSRCTDEETPSQPYEIYEYINGQYQCVDGWYWGQVIYFHLGDDEGMDFNQSAYEHELMHFFQDRAGMPYSDVVGTPGVVHYIILLPDEEDEEEGEQWPGLVQDITWEVI